MAYSEREDFSGPGQQWRGGVVPWLAILLGTVAPAVLAFFFVHRFGVNLPAHDEWNFMPTVEAFYQGHNWPHLLFEHYGEHRIPIPKLIILLLTPFTKLNVRVEMYLSAFLMLSTALVLVRLLQKTGGSPWLVMPIGWLLVSTAQYENLLVGWQFQILLMNFLASATILFIAAERPTTRCIAAPISAACATFSFANGLMLWPVAFLFSVMKGRRLEAALWFVLGAVAVWTYQAGYQGYRRTPTDQSPNYTSALLNDPTGVIQLFLGSIGNNFGAGRIGDSIVSGAVLSALSIALVLWAATKDRPLNVERRIQQTTWGRSIDLLPWLCLLLFSSLSVGAIAVGRSMAWREFVTSSRYLTVSVFIPVAVLVLGTAYVRARRVDVAQRAVLFIATLLLFVGVWQHVRTIKVGWIVGNADHDQKLRVRECVIRYQEASDDCLRLIYAPDARWVRRYACTLERWHLGPFVGVEARKHGEGLGCDGTLPLGGSHFTGPSAGTNQGPPAAAKIALVWISNDVPARMKSGTTVPIHVVVKNAGDWTWPDPQTANPLNPDGSYAVRLSYKWVEPGSNQEPAPARADLSVSVPPGGATMFTINLVAAQPGAHQLEFDLVVELVTWFSAKGNEKLRIPVVIE